MSDAELMNIEDYLERIDYHGNLEVNQHTLTSLHRSHLRNVAFESFDIFLGNTIRLDLPRIYEKVVQNRRGGFCYELNGLFGWLLEKLGFRVTQLSARVMNNGRLGQKFAHMFLRVDLQEDWIADVGFGDSFLDPLKLEYNLEQQQQTGIYRLSESMDSVILQARNTDEWEHKYQFHLTAHDYPEFADMCIYQQTSPDSYFAQAPICTKLTEDGRITISDRRLIITQGEYRKEQTIESVDHYQQILKQCFGISLSKGDAARLYKAGTN